MVFYLIYISEFFIFRNMIDHLSCGTKQEQLHCQIYHCSKHCTALIRLNCEVILIFTTKVIFSLAHKSPQTPHSAVIVSISKTIFCIHQSLWWTKFSSISWGWWESYSYFPFAATTFSIAHCIACAKHHSFHSRSAYTLFMVVTPLKYLILQIAASLAGACPTPAWTTFPWILHLLNLI
jgi:hypothetical protein